MLKPSAIKPFHVMDILARCQQMEAQGHDIIHMEIGEPDFPAPQPILDAGIVALEKQQTFYTSAQGLPELRAAISQDYAQRFNCAVEEQQIFITPGASGAIQLVFSYVLQQRKTLMIGDPTYPCNRNVAELFKAKIEAVAVDEISDFQLDLEAVQTHWHEDVAAVLIASPSNPTGTVSDKQELLAIADFLAVKGSVLIVDEIYQGLNYGNTPSSVAGMRDNIFVINSFSKYFGMTGWRVGWCVTPNAYIKSLDAIAQNTYLASSTPAQFAALAAYNEQTFEIVEQRRNIFKQRRDLICDALNKMPIKVPCIPQGAFYVYVNIADVSEDSFQFCQQLLEKTGVAVTPGCDFGQYRAQQYIRLAYTSHEDRLYEGMKRLERYIS